MGFNCLKARVTSGRQFTFYHSVPINFWYSFYRPRKDERLESILELPSGIEHGTPGLGIQQLNHLAIVPLSHSQSKLAIFLAEHPIFIVVLHKTNIESDIFADRNMRPRCIVDAQMTSNLKSFASNIKRI